MLFDRSTCDSIPVALAEIDQNGHIYNPNAAFQTLFGCDHKEGDFWDYLVIREDGDWIRPRLTSPSGMVQTAVMMKTADGAGFMAQVSITPQAQDDLPKILWVTKSHEPDKSAASLQSFFQNAPYPLMVCEPQTASVLQRNEAANKLLSIEESAAGHIETLDEIIRPKTRKVLFQRLETEREICDVRLMVTTCDGQRIPAIASLRWVDMGKGHVVIFALAVGVSASSKKATTLKKEIVARDVVAPLLNAIPCPTIICALDDAAILQINRAASLVLQVLPQNVDNARARLPEFFKSDNCETLFAQLREHGVVKDATGTLISAMRKTFDCQISAHRVVIEGKACAVFGFREVSTKGEQLADHFFELAPMPMMLVDKQNRAYVKRLNRRAQELFSQGSGKLLPQIRLKDILGLRVYNRFADVLDSAGFVEDFETEIETAYGEKLACLLSGQQVVIEGRCNILVGIQDITERKQSEVMLERFFNAAPLPMILLRQLDQTIVRTNRRAKELFTIHDDALPGSIKLSRLIQEEGLETLMQELKMGGFVDDFELQFETAYGENIWGLFSAQLLSLPDEDLILIGINDITLRKQTEEELSISKEKAIEATKQKSVFLSTMSHEIRTPMTGVLGMLELLYMSDLDGEQREALGVIKDSATTLLTIIDDILDYSKIEAGRLELEKIRFNLWDVVERAAELMGGRARSKGLELLCHIDCDVPKTVLGDPTRLRQVILNLIGNAVKFTNEGAVVVRVKQLLRQNGSTFLRFEVEDDGIGISEERQKLLFKPFSQTENSTSRKYGGSGLGLSICKALTELMTGQIGVSSTEGEGATFWFEIGLEESGDLDKDNIIQLHSDKILLIQQHPETRAFYRNVLEGAGADVCAVEDVSEVKDAEQFGCAIIDNAKDGINAFDVISQAQDHLGLKASQIVLTSSDFSETVMARAKEMGIADRYFKPVSSQTLLRTVARQQGQKETSGPEVIVQARPQMSREAALEKNKLILFAEDNATNQLVIGKQLTRLGYAFDIADNGVMALEMWENGDYALILSDCRMPEMDGLDLARNIRRKESKNGAKQRIPIIALTANATAEDEGDCYNAGMDDYLVKPLKFELLGTAMGKWLPLAEEGTSEQLQDNACQAVVETVKPPVNLSALGEILGMDDPEMFADILTFFVETLDELMADLKTAIEDGDPTRISDCAHAAKGASRNAAATQLGNSFERLEKNAITMSADEIHKLHEDLNHLVEQVKTYVKSM